MNPTEKWLQDLKGALPQIDGLDVPERLRRTLARACSECQVRAEDDLLDRYARRGEGEKWTEADSAELVRMLGEFGGHPKTWAEGNRREEQIALHFGRPGKFIRKKALELGAWVALDWYGNPERED